MTVRIGTSEIGGTFSLQGAAVAALLLRKGREVEIFPSGGASVASAEGLHEDALDFGFSAANWVGRALRGEAPFSQPIDIRMVGPANVGPMFFVVRADSDLHAIDDMRGRRVSVNLRDSGMIQHVHNIFGALGISFDAFEPVHLNFAEGADALRAGEIDAQWQCPIPNPVMTKLADSTAIRVLEYGPGQLETVLGRFGTYRRAVMEKGCFRGVDRDTAQVGVFNVITTHARTDPALVYDFASAMVGNARELGETQPLFRGLAALYAELEAGGKSVFEPDGVPLHPGALQAYRDAGLLVP
jgi:TRAP transporter TAXI family solute receptor